MRASHADGSDLVVDDDTLRFRSEPGYFGPASISSVGNVLLTWPPASSTG